MKTIAPVFIAKTRSFWLGIVPLVLTLLDSIFASIEQGGDGGPVANLLAALIGTDPETVRGWLLLISPVWGLVIAQQRSGLSRPYTMNPAKEAAIVQTVQDGKEAFEAGKMVGQAIRARGK